SDYISAALAPTVMSLGGLGTFNRIDLQKKLAGKVASASASMDERTERIGGSAAPKDLETMFQLAYLTFTAPRLDTVVFRTFVGQAQPQLANRAPPPDAA